MPSHMTTHPWHSLVVLALVCCSACGHPKPQVVPVATGIGIGVGGAPLPDGSYPIRAAKEFDNRTTLEVMNGQLSLTKQQRGEQQTLPLRFVGPGPMWNVTSRDPEGKEMAAELLVLDESHSWIHGEGLDHGLEISRIQDVPARLQGYWVTVPGILEGGRSLTALQISQISGALIERGGQRETKFSASWLQNRNDAWPNLMAAAEEGGVFLPMVEHNGLLGVFFPDEGMQLLAKKQAPAPQALGLEHLQKRLFLYLSGRKAFDLKCHAQGCDQLELDVASDPVRWKAVAERPAFAVRLRTGDSDSQEMVLVSMAKGVLAAGPRGMVALTPLAAAEIPSSLMGSWETSVVFPVQGFDLTEVHIGKGGVETRRHQGKSSPAYLVQSAFDDGLLLLASTASRRHWDLWRFVQTRDGWYLTQWPDGAGPIALHRGVAPAFCPVPEMTLALAEFCSLEQHQKRIAKWPEAFAADPLVAVKSFSEDAQGSPRFRQAGLRRFFRTVMRVVPDRMEATLAETLFSYNLPPMSCPALTDIAARAQKASPPSSKGEGEFDQDTKPSLAWSYLDRDTKEVAVSAINKMWAGSLAFYETDTLDSHGKPVSNYRFPENAALTLTPDCCKERGACPAASVWQNEPWRSLNFSPPEDSRGMRFGYVSAGTGQQARFLALVAVDPECTGKPVYVWRRGIVNANGDVSGAYQPATGDQLPNLSLDPGVKRQTE
jgi:hypothetical protein